MNDLRALLSEAESLTAGTVAEQTSDRLADLRARLKEAQESLSEYYEIAKERVTEGARRTDAAIRSHPYESIVVALGVGVLIGALLRRR
ncbi:MAG: DUF883 family protein [Opitutaceae bacterium]|nr:DUF883 family protein [Opitutaceae bacterium]